MNNKILSRHYAIAVTNAILAIYDLLSRNILNEQDRTHLRSSQRRLVDRLIESHLAMNTELWRLSGKTKDSELE